MVDAAPDSIASKDLHAAMMEEESDAGGAHGILL
jgi:hypothetical protein